MPKSEPMNPKTQDCLGHYLYGAGYYSREQNTLGVVTGQKSPPHFCLSCPMREECEHQHEARTRRMMPQAVEHFERRMREARRREIPPTMAAVFLAQKGLDPFALLAVENFTQGHADRGGKPLAA
jgi:hypothetical protein